jgi:hypothetical protein
MMNSGRLLTRTSAGRGVLKRKRIVFGGILSRMEAFTVRRGSELADYRVFDALKKYPHPLTVRAIWTFRLRIRSKEREWPPNRSLVTLSSDPCFSSKRSHEDGALDVSRRQPAMLVVPSNVVACGKTRQRYDGGPVISYQRVPLTSGAETPFVRPLVTTAPVLASVLQSAKFTMAPSAGSRLDPYEIRSGIGKNPNVCPRHRIRHPTRKPALRFSCEDGPSSSARGGR